MIWPSKSFAKTMDAQGCVLKANYRKKPRETLFFFPKIDKKLIGFKILQAVMSYKNHHNKWSHYNPRSEFNLFISELRENRKTQSKTLD